MPSRWASGWMRRSPVARAAERPPISAMSARSCRPLSCGTLSATRRWPPHTRDMCETAATDLALSNALLVAKTLSLTASDLLRDTALVEAAKSEFADRSS